MRVAVRHLAPLEYTQNEGGVLNFVVGTVHQRKKNRNDRKYIFFQTRKNPDEKKVIYKNDDIWRMRGKPCHFW